MVVPSNNGEIYMTKNITRVWAVFAIVAALILTITMAVVVLVAASTESATDRSGFDAYSASGCTDDTGVYHSTPSSIKLLSGWGEFNDMSRFATFDIDFYVYIDATSDWLYITVGDDEDSGNYIEIGIQCVSTTRTKVDIEDAYKSQTNSIDNSEVVDTYSTWQAVSIKITHTEEVYDGTKTRLDAEIGGVDIIENYALRDSELSAEYEERTFDEIKFESKGSEDTAHVDDIDIDTSGTGTTKINTTFIIIIFIAVLIVVLAVVMRKKGGVIKGTKQTIAKAAGRK